MLLENKWLVMLVGYVIKSTLPFIIDTIIRRVTCPDSDERHSCSGHVVIQSSQHLNYPNIRSSC